MKTLLLFAALALSINVFGQSKKEQIITLNNSIDSLNAVLVTTRDNSTKEIKSLNDKIKEVSDEVTALKSDLTNLQTSNVKLTKENEKLKLDLEELSQKNLTLEARVRAFQEEKYSSQKSFTSITENLQDWENGYKISLNDNRTSDDVQYIGVLKTLNDAVFFISGKEIKFGSYEVKSEGSLVEMKFISGDYTILMEYDEDNITGAYTEGTINLAFGAVLQLKTNFVMEGWGW